MAKKQDGSVIASDYPDLVNCIPLDLFWMEVIKMEAYKAGDVITTTSQGSTEEWTIMEVLPNLVALKARSSSGKIEWREKSYVTAQIGQGVWKMKQ